jgi:phosphate transport system substrate-binding protein
MHSQADQAATSAAVRFFDWAYRDGAQTVAKFGYVTVPPTVADRVRESWGAVLGHGAPAEPGRK